MSVGEGKCSIEEGVWEGGGEENEGVPKVVTTSIDLFITDSIKHYYFFYNFDFYL